MHVTGFAAAAKLTDEQITSIAAGGADDSCWDEADAVLIRMCDALHAEATLGDRLWQQLKTFHTDEAIPELLLPAGFYRTTRYLANALALPLEAGMARFDEYT